jgi:hypothetical protein
MSDFERTEKRVSGLLRGGLGCLGLLGALLAFLTLLFVWFVGNEQRDDEVARRSVPVGADDRWKAPYGELVSVTGVLTAGEALGDGLYLKPGPYLRLSRQVERYQARESRDAHWESSEQEGPSVLPATAPRVGAFPIDALALEVSARQKPVKLSRDMLLPGVQGQLVDEEYLFVGKGSPKAPELGDQRIRFEAVSLGETVTVFAKAGEGVLVPYTRGEDKPFYKARWGAREEALSELKRIETGGRTMVVFLAAFTTSLGMLLMLWATRPFIDWPEVLGPLGPGVLLPAGVGGVLLTVLTLFALFVTRGSAYSLLLGPGSFFGGVAFLVFSRQHRRPVYPG